MIRRFHALAGEMDLMTNPNPQPKPDASRRDGMPPPYAPTGLRYEERLDQDARWALAEGSRFFEDKGAVRDALRRIAQRLDELGVRYAVGGGMAVFVHGFRRFTEHIDILVTRESLRRIHEQLEGRGYVPPYSGSNRLRDAELGVKIGMHEETKFWSEE